MTKNRVFFLLFLTIFTWFLGYFMHKIAYFMHEMAYFMHEIAVNTKSVNHQIRPLFWCIFAKNTQKHHF